MPWEVSWQSWPGQGYRAHEVHEAVRVWGLTICSDELSLLTHRNIVTTAVAGQLLDHITMAESAK